MDDLVSRKELLSEFGCAGAVKYGNFLPGQQEHSYSTMMMYEINDVIQGAESVDALPVIHAYWSEKSVCSNCDCKIPLDTDESGWDVIHMDAAYCPRCGAMMDAQ